MSETTEAMRQMDLLRFATAGSVDDGKSTLIGRLLLDSKAIFEDQMEAIHATSQSRGYDYDDLSLFMAGSPVTADFIADRLEQWWTANRERFPKVTKLVLNLDNGPENHSRRTQFLKRMVAFAHESRLDIELAYYPPYHSKYNPIERCWGILELHWDGALLDSVEAVLGYAGTMTWKGNHPEVVLIEEAYSKGVKLSQKEMKELESEVVRLPTLEKWFVSLPGRSGMARKN